MLSYNELHEHRDLVAASSASIEPSTEQTLQEHVLNAWRSSRPEHKGSGAEERQKQ